MNSEIDNNERHDDPQKNKLHAPPRWRIREVFGFIRRVPIGILKPFHFLANVESYYA